MTVIAQQIGTDIVGSFADDQSGVKSSGIVFGRSEADSVMIYYLAAKADGTTVITFADGRLIDQNTIEGNFYYQDSNMISVGGTPYKAIRIK